MGMNNMDNYMEQMAVLCENNDSIRSEERRVGKERKAWITR